MPQAVSRTDSQTPGAPLSRFLYEPVHLRALIEGQASGFRECFLMAHRAMASLLRHIRKLAGGRSDFDVSDGQLLQRFAVLRDEEAFAVLLLRHGPMVLGVCQRLLDNPADAEDVFQATFLVLIRQAGTIR